MALGFADIFLVLSFLLLLGYLYLTSTFNFWKDRNVKGQKPLLFFGNIKDATLKKIPFGECLKSIYDFYPNEKVIGFFDKRTPCLMLRDAELIKDVLIKDFSNFVERGTLPVAKKSDPFSQHLFRLEPARWQILRPKLSPAFTSGKLKNMFYLMTKCADYFSKFIEKSVEKGNVLKVKDYTNKFIVDVVGECVFGLQMNAMSDQENEFLKFVSKAVGSSTWSKFKLMVRDTSLTVFELLSPIFYDKEMNGFFINTMRDTMKYRKENNVRRHDFVDLLMDVRDSANLNSDIELPDDLLTAQAFVFFVAGFETSSITVNYTLYELALNPLIQEKLRHEIHEELNENNGELTYDSIKNMKYLHQVFSETLRKYPPLPFLTRIPMKDYTFKGTDVTIPKNLKVYIPILAIQRDPKIYPEPEVYDPERFNAENVQKRHSSHYLPFGDGPRNCIGARFAHFQSKVAILTIVKDYLIEVCDKTQIPMVFNPSHPILFIAPKEDIHLKLSKISQEK